MVLLLSSPSSPLSSTCDTLTALNMCRGWSQVTCQRRYIHHTPLKILRESDLYQQVLSSNRRTVFHTKRNDRSRMGSDRDDNNGPDFIISFPSISSNHEPTWRTFSVTINRQSRAVALTNSYSWCRRLRQHSPCSHLASQSTKHRAAHLFLCPFPAFWSFAAGSLRSSCFTLFHQARQPVLFDIDTFERDRLISIRVQVSHKRPD